MTVTTDCLAFAPGADPRDHLHDVHQLLAGLVLPLLRDIRGVPKKGMDNAGLDALVTVLDLVRRELHMLAESRDQAPATDDGETTD